MNVSRYRPALSGLSLLAAAILAFTQPALALSVTSSNDDGHVAQNTIDGSLAPESRWASMQTNATLTYDFGKLQKLDALQIAFYKGDVRTYNIEIDVSEDGKNWSTEVFSGYSPQKNNALQTIPLKSKPDARYMRITGHGNNQSSWTSFTEVKPTLKAPTNNSSGSGTSSGEFTSQKTLKAMFDLESSRSSGGPFPSSDDGTLSFSALKSKFDSGGGHGYREELKVKDNLRTTLAETKEHFSATITPNFSDGAQSIVAQYHVNTKEVLVMVYVQDNADSNGADHKKGNGIFDILAKVKGPDEQYHTTSLGTITAGQSFDLKIDLVNSKASISAVINGNKKGVSNVAVKDPGDKIYFKFGDYLQAYLPNGQHTTKASDWEAYYKANNITQDSVKLSKVLFKRDK